jgi:uncharacterized protein (UPF0333 family)
MWTKIMGWVTGAVSKATISMGFYLTLAAALASAGTSGYLTYKVEQGKIQKLTAEVASYKTANADNAKAIEQINSDAKTANSTCDTRLGMLRSEINRLNKIDSTGGKDHVQPTTAISGDPLLDMLHGMFTGSDH